MTKRSVQYVLGVVLLVCLPHGATAQVTMPSVFGDGMVLQRELPTPIFGWASPGERVVVEFADQSKDATADEAGRWQVRLDPMSANREGQTLKISSSNTIEYKDILVGDVWICSGQSNMEWSVRSSMNPDEEIANSDYPMIRLFDVPGHTTSAVPRDQCGGSWQVCGPETVAGFSAVGYFFGRKLVIETDVPVGLIGTNWGGTRIEPWTPAVGFRQVPELAAISDQVDRFDPSTESGRQTWMNYLQQVKDYAAAADDAWRTGGSLPQPVAAPGFTAANQPTTIYHAMVHPLAPYGIRGAIWYQGESNGNEGIEYYHKMRALIEGWRTVWNQPDFPIYFYYVQLANFQQPTENPAGGDGWARLREAQRKALEIPHTGMAVILDIGEADDIHPRNKQDVGDRLARWALRDVHEANVVGGGPLYRQMVIEDGQIRLRFDDVGSGLMIGTKDGLAPVEEDSDGTLMQFAIAGEDRQWHWASATIDGDSVIVSSENVEQPVAVRYGYSMNPAGANLYNKEGLPASSFRTDDW